MTRFAKNSWYTHKNLGSKKEENALRMKVLRYVLAVGFVLSPWLGGEAYADAGNITFVKDQGTNLMQNGVAHIYAEQVDAANKVGFNRFQTFNVAAGEIANLYFQKEAGGATLNSLVNSVESQISISGTVNAIRNNKIGGNLYFVSPNGMVVGSSGVINAGALTAVVPASLNYLQTLQQAVEGIKSDGPSIKGWGALAVGGTIVINGQINTATGINLEAQTIQITKASGSETAPSLLTGVVFQKLVNIDSYEALPIANNRLIAYKDEETNIIIVADPSNLKNATGDELLQGDGRIRVYARKDVPDYGIQGTATFTESVVNAIGDVAIESGRTIEIDKPTSDTTNTSSTVNKTSITSGKQIKLVAETGDIYNAGTIVGANTIDASAGYDKSESNYANIINYGTIQSTNGGMSLAADRLLTNTGAILAKDQIALTVGGTLTNQGTIESTSSNVQAHIGRNFENIAVYNNESTENRTLKGGIIEAGGNVQVDYNLDTENTGIGAATEAGTIDGIYNSGLIWAKGENGKDPVYDDKGNIVNSGSGNIWLTSSYNIENTATGQMIAGRQITLNARDFLHNYGLIEGVTYLDIKSIMGYVYNHASGVIRATGGNIDLSTGQANLQIDGDTNGQKKEEYRKFTPIIIEGKVEATSDDDKNNETREGNIKITAYLGDIYINGGTIETKAKTSETGDVKAEAGNVILDAAQNITIGFQTESALADDPTTDGANLNNETEREYYRPILDSNLVPSSPCDEPATISGSNITLTSGDNEKYYILISNTTTGSNALPASNTLTASNAITINTDNMNIVGGTFNAGTLEANLAKSGALSITGGTINAANVNSNRNMIINGGAINTGTAQGRLSANNISMESGSVSGEDVTIAAAGQVQLQGGSLTATNAMLKVTNGTAGANSILESASGYNLSVGSLSLSANQGNITLNGANNVLQGVTLANVGGNVEIVNGNETNNKALTIATTNGATVGGTINVTNNGEGITVEGINATNDVNLTAGDNITVAGDVNAANASFNAGQDFIQNSGTITASGAVVTAGRDVKLNAGSMEASTSASLTAGSATSVAEGHGYISEGTGYALIAPQVTASAVKAITLDSSANQLVNVDITKVGRDLAIGSGNKNSTEALQVNIGQGKTVDGLTIKNYKNVGDNSSNDIVLAGALSANRITISANGDVTMTAGDKVTINSGTINANSVTAKDTDLFVNGGTINVGTLAASKGLNIASNSSNTTNITANNITAGGSIGITGGNVVTTSVAADEALNITGGTVSSDGAVSLSGATGVTIGSAATINTGGDLTISSSGGSVTNNRALTANGGSVTLSGQTDVINSANITAAQDVTMTATTGNVNNSKVVKANGGNINLTGGTNINLQDGYGLEASDTINLNTDNIEITGGTIKANTLAASGSLNITGGKVDSTGALTISGAKGVTIGSQADITTGNNLTIASSGGAVENNRILNITTGSVTLSGSGGVTNNMNITAAQDIILQSTTGAITNSGILSAGQGIGLTSTEGTILNNGMLTARGRSVALKGYKGIINNGYIEANGSVYITSTGGSVTNRAGIVAGKSFATPAASPFSLRARARAMARAVDNGSVVISGKDGVINHNDNDNVNTSISAAGSVSITSEVGAVQNSSAVNTSGSVEISGSNVTNSGALTTTGGSVEISGSEGVTNNADIKAGSGVSLNATTGDVKTSGTIQAGEDVSMTSNSGKIESSSAVTTSGSVEISGSSGVNNSANITANDNVTMSSGAGSVTNSSDVKAGTGSVEISGNGGVNNTADITANQNVNLSANAGAISNAGSVTAETGNIGLNSNNGITSTAEGSSLNVNSLNGSISAATTYGEVNISEIIAGGNATASSQNGSVSIGTVAGNDVVLTGGSNVTIGSVTGSDVAITGGSNSDVNVDNITVDNSLKLQGDNITATNVNRSENASGALNVDVSGAGGTSSTAQGDVNLKIDGDVVFNNLNVTDANIETTGTLDASKMHVEGKAQITSSNATVNVYGKDVTPDPNDRNAIQDKGGGVSLTIDSNGVKSDDLGMDYPVQLSGKLVDYDPYDTYLEHYGDVADIFGRTDLVVAAESPSGDFAQGGVVILKQDAEGLRIEEQKKEE